MHHFDATRYVLHGVVPKTKRENEMIQFSLDLETDTYRTVGTGPVGMEPCLLYCLLLTVLDLDSTRSF
jgi:hypothetical protein